MVEPSQNPSFDLYNQKLQPDLDSMKYHISSAVDAKTGECPENFKCGICLQLVHLPEQCSSCDQMFCKECFMEWRVKRKQTCSNCKKETISEPLNRILKKILDETMLKGCPIEGCQASQTSMTYEQLIKHQQSQCQQVLVSCPYDKCKRTFKR
ncbi:hypothetical protein FGO68_gene3998 [Halteria grandinella]|uniref:RING-type domain-containing protein n=1 Tax=Halteria grandinella TaxID=5974 RepID=A0A8J8NK67_HALGN|nr:hypothetical protein FGO68_gene3998 [Halteria grandinella]